MSSPRRQLLEEAAEVISVDRAATHGEAENSFAKIAGVWSWWLSVRGHGPLTAVDVAVMMDLFKTARIAGNPAHRDNWLDKAGYSALGYELSTNKELSDGNTSETAQCQPHDDGPRDDGHPRPRADTLDRRSDLRPKF